MRWLKNLFLLWIVSLCLSLVVCIESVGAMKINYLSKEFQLFIRGIEDASRYYNIPPKLLYAIAYVESGFNFRAVNVNRNRTRDYGIFQINETNLKRFGYSKGVAFHPYWSAYLAAYILRECINEVGYSWKAVDCYNKGSSRAKENSKYVWKVYRAMQKLENTSLNQFAFLNIENKKN